MLQCFGWVPQEQFEEGRSEFDGFETVQFEPSEFYADVSVNGLVGPGVVRMVGSVGEMA